MQNRTEAASKPKRQTQVLDEENEKRAHRMTSNDGNSFAMVCFEYNNNQYNIKE